VSLVTKGNQETGETKVNQELMVSQVKTVKQEVLVNQEDGVDEDLEASINISHILSRVGWNYKYLCYQCLSPLMLWVRISTRAKCTTLCHNVCQLLATGWWFSPGSPVSSINKNDSHEIAEMLLKVALNTIKQTSIFLAGLTSWLNLRNIFNRHVY